MPEEHCRNGHSLEAQAAAGVHHRQPIDGQQHWLGWRIADQNHSRGIRAGKTHLLSARDKTNVILIHTEFLYIHYELLLHFL